MKESTETMSETESAELGELDNMLKRLKSEDPEDELLKKIKSSKLDWASYDMLSYYFRLKDSGFSKEEVERFKSKLEKVKESYGAGEVSQYSLLQYLENKINLIG